MRGFISGLSVLWPLDEKSRLIGKDPMLERLKAGGEGDGRGRDA